MDKAAEEVWGPRTVSPFGPRKRPHPNIYSPKVRGWKAKAELVSEASLLSCVYSHLLLHPYICPCVSLSRSSPIRTPVLWGLTPLQPSLYLGHPFISPHLYIQSHPEVLG